MNNPTKVKIGEKEYPINTDFRVAIKCNSIATDETIGDYERALAVIYTLYGDKGLEDKENHQKLLELGQRFLSCGKDIEQNLKVEEPDMDFVQDYDYIVASFMSDYHIDLNKSEMHWWTFYNLLNGLSNSELGSCCILNRIRNLRNYDTSEIKDIKMKSKIEEAKRQVRLKKKEKPLTEQQRKNAEEFDRLAGLS